MAPTSPQLDRYRLIDVIGTGGFSTVYRAIDERFDTHVAIKVLAENHSLNPEVRERFITEVQLLRRLAGIPTVAVYDLGETDSGQPYAVMALADGDLVSRVTTLRSQQIPIGPPEIDRAIDELTRSLSALHAKGIVHRDVKPMNLLVFGDPSAAQDPASSPMAPVPAEFSGQTSSGRAAAQSDQLLDDSESLRLADLGFAKDLAQQSGLTVGGGTPGFMPPEQAQAGRVDARADIYAATAVVAWLICGEVPVHKTPQEIGQRSAEILGFNASADGLLAGMARDPGDRPASMGEWRDILRRTLTNPARVIATGWAPPQSETAGVGEGSAPSPAGTGSSINGPGGAPGGPSARKRLATGVLAAGFGLAGVLTGSVLFQGDGDTTTQTEVGTTHSESLGDLTVTVTGPDQVRVGDTLTFTADTTGAIEARWVAPDGSLHDGSDSLSLLASKLGDSQVAMIATSADGETVEVTAEFSVVEAGG